MTMGRRGSLFLGVMGTLRQCQDHCDNDMQGIIVSDGVMRTLGQCQDHCDNEMQGIIVSGCNEDFEAMPGSL